MANPGNLTAEQRARVLIDAKLTASGWVLQNRDEMNLYAAAGVAVREYRLKPDFGKADYLLFVDQKAVGVVEAKPEGHTLSGVQIQSGKYSEGLPDELDAPHRPLPFLYSSSGSETLFRNELDPDPRSRRVFSFHRPETFTEWLKQKPLRDWVDGWRSPDELGERHLDLELPATLRSRLRAMPDVVIPGLWQNKVEGITRLERSLFDNRPRALIQMATGSGKTKLAITSTYRLIKYAGARRVLFLVDRANLGEQAEKEFQSYVAPDVNRKFTELYNVQRLTSNTIGDSAKIVITTIQRLYSMLRGEPELDPEVEEHSGYDPTVAFPDEPVDVAYNVAIPIEYFDVIWIDECHRSIYTIWRQVLEYFDAFLIGLTATPGAATFGFFNKNLVMEYGHEQAVADGVNVSFDVYDIRTKITRDGSIVESKDDNLLGYRERATRRMRWSKPEEDYIYTANELDRSVVAKDQIRTVIRTFRDRLFSEIFLGRTEVPKTLVFAKDDSHAEDVVEILREEFGRGDQFVRKITYKTTGSDPKQLIQDFRTSFWPRVAVTVDMVATGTDIKPIEILLFMRSVKSRILFDQMKGRGVRVVDSDELRAVTPDAHAKDHFVIVDAVGVLEEEKMETTPLDREKGVSLKELLEHVASGGTNENYLSSLASRLARIERQCTPADEEAIREASGGATIGGVAQEILKALAPEKVEEVARQEFGVPEESEPTEHQIKTVADRMRKEAVKPLAANPKFRRAILELKARLEQVIDEVSQDEVLRAGVSEDAKKKAKFLVESFEQYVVENRDQIDAIEFLLKQSPRRRLRYRDIKALADVIGAPPNQWTPERLWRAYELVDSHHVRATSGRRMLADIISLVRFAIHRQGELKPFADEVRERFASWISGKKVTDEQRRWLEMMRDHVATSLEINLDDLDLTPFSSEGGLGRARLVFGPELPKVLDELNDVLAA